MSAAQPPDDWPDDHESDRALARVEDAPLAVPGEIPIRDRFHGASAQKFTPEQEAVLFAPPDPETELEIKPTAFGEVYPPHHVIRKRLNRAFGAGGWAMVPAGAPIKNADYVCQEWDLMAEGRYLATGFGEQKFQMGSNTLSFPTALEGAKSDALVRCCKGIGMFTECWDRDFTEKFKALFGERYTDRGKTLWRKKAIGTTTPPPTEPPKDKGEWSVEQGRAILRRFRDQLGGEVFDTILEDHGVLTVDEVTDAPHARRIYKAMKMAADRGKK